jgi:hypothetical protein
MNIWELKLHHGLNTEENNYKMDKKYIQFFIMDEKFKFIQWTKKLNMKNEKLKKKMTHSLIVQLLPWATWSGKWQ